MLEHSQRMTWPTLSLHCFCKLLGIYVDLGWGQQFVSSTSPGRSPVSIVWVYLLLQTVCQNTHTALTLQVDDCCFLALSQWVIEKIPFLWEVTLFCSPFLSTEINVSSLLFSLWRIFNEHLTERLQLKFSFCFYDSTWTVSSWIAPC